MSDERITELEAALSAEKAKVAEAVRELGMVADYVERHWQGAGLPLKADWIIREVSGWTTSYEQAADELEARAEAAEAEAARLWEALEPFAREATEDDGSYRADWDTQDDAELVGPQFCEVTYGDFRRAYAALRALAEAKPDPGDAQ